LDRRENMERATDLRARDVINIVDGRRLGAISDLEIDLDTGRITAIVVPAPGPWWTLFGREGDYVIRWDRIRKIGEDVILVELPGYSQPRYDRR
jgi:YlmC/YmxH family sporulation protein